MHSGSSTLSSPSKAELLVHQNKPWVIFHVSRAPLTSLPQVIHDGNPCEFVIGKNSISLALVKYLILIRFNYIEMEDAYFPYFDVTKAVSSSQIPDDPQLLKGVNKLINHFTKKRPSSDSSIYRKLSEEEHARIKGRLRTSTWDVQIVMNEHRMISGEDEFNKSILNATSHRNFKGEVRLHAIIEAKEDCPAAMGAPQTPSISNLFFPLIHKFSQVIQPAPPEVPFEEEEKKESSVERDIRLVEEAELESKRRAPSNHDISSPSFGNGKDLRPAAVRKFSDWEELDSSRENVDVSIKEKLFVDLSQMSEEDLFSTRVGPPAPAGSFQSNLRKQLSGIQEEAPDQYQQHFVSSLEHRKESQEKIQCVGYGKPVDLYQLIEQPPNSGPALNSSDFKPVQETKKGCSLAEGKVPSHHPQVIYELMKLLKKQGQVNIDDLVGVTEKFKDKCNEEQIRSCKDETCIRLMKQSLDVVHQITSKARSQFSKRKTSNHDSSFSSSTKKVASNSESWLSRSMHLPATSSLGSFGSGSREAIRSKLKESQLLKQRISLNPILEEDVLASSAISQSLVMDESPLRNQTARTYDYCLSPSIPFKPQSGAPTDREEKTSLDKLPMEQSVLVDEQTFDGSNKQSRRIWSLPFAKEGEPPEEESARASVIAASPKNKDLETPL